MKPLHLKVRWDSQTDTIQFKWDYRDLGNAKYVLAFSVDQSGRPDGQYSFFHDISHPQNPQDNMCFHMPFHSSLVCLQFLRFVVFCSETPRQPTPDKIAELASDPRYVALVLTGFAKLVWSEKARTFKDLKEVAFSITSDAVIPPGVLGYIIGDNALVFPVPLQINNGKTVTPSILIRASQDPVIVPLDPAYAVNLQITKKKKSFFSL